MPDSKRMSTILLLKNKIWGVDKIICTKACGSEVRVYSLYYKLYLMKNRFFFQLLAVSMLFIGFASCKKDKDPANEIIDSTGLKTSLNWSLTGGGTATATDIDMELYKGTGANKISTGFESTSGTGFESFVMPASIEDGDYTLEVTYYDLTDAGKMNFTFQGNSNANLMYEIKDIAFSTTENFDSKDVIRINKSGNKFTVSKL